jgi:hypothetical protein
LFIVANHPTAQVLLAAGVPHQRVKALGFPVSPAFAQAPSEPLTAPRRDERREVLYVINTGKAIDRLLRIENVRLTITEGAGTAPS